jgi:predicted transposase/invertase (TIGR01784 family)
VVQFEQTDDIIDICMDNVFKAVFTKDRPESRIALSEMLSVFVRRKLSVIAITANEPTIENLRDRQIRFDINCKADNGELINVEMTLNPDIFEPVRLEFHAGKLFIGQDIKGADKKYNDLKPAYQISFLVNKSFFDDKEIVHSFEYYDPKNKVSLNGRTRIITVELGKLEKTIGSKSVEQMTAAERWAYFLRYTPDVSKRQNINKILQIEEGIEMASEVLISISKDEEERAWLRSREKYLLDTQSQLAYARHEARTEGRNEERQRAEQKEKAIADFLRASGTPDDVISRAFSVQAN